MVLPSRRNAHFHILRNLRAILGHLGGILGDLGAILGHLGGILGDLGAVLGHLGAILGHLGAILGTSWAILGTSWGHLRAILGPSWANLGDLKQKKRDGQKPSNTYGKFMLLAPQMAQDTLMMTRKSSKMAPRCPQTAPSWPKMHARTKMAPGMAQDVPKMAPR